MPGPFPWEHFGAHQRDSDPRSRFWLARRYLESSPIGGARKTHGEVVQGSSWRSGLDGALGPLRPALAYGAGQQPRGAGGRGRVRERWSGTKREASQGAEAQPPTLRVRGCRWPCARASASAQGGSFVRITKWCPCRARSPDGRAPCTRLVPGSRLCACSATAGPGGVSVFPRRPREVGRPGRKDQARAAVTGSNPARGSSARSTTALARGGRRNA